MHMHKLEENSGCPALPLCIIPALLQHPQISVYRLPNLTFAVQAEVLCGCTEVKTIDAGLGWFVGQVLAAQA